MAICHHFPFYPRLLATTSLLSVSIHWPALTFSVLNLKSRWVFKETILPSQTILGSPSAVFLVTTTIAWNFFMSWGAELCLQVRALTAYVPDSGHLPPSSCVSLWKPNSTRGFVPSQLLVCPLGSLLWGLVQVKSRLKTPGCKAQLMACTATATSVLTGPTQRPPASVLTQQPQWPMPGSHPTSQ